MKAVAFCGFIQNLLISILICFYFSPFSITYHHISVLSLLHQAWHSPPGFIKRSWNGFFQCSAFLNLLSRILLNKLPNCLTISARISYIYVEFSLFTKIQVSLLLKVSYMTWYSKLSKTFPNKFPLKFWIIKIHISYRSFWWKLFSWWQAYSEIIVFFLDWTWFSLTFFRIF